MFHEDWFSYLLHKHWETNFINRTADGALIHLKRIFWKFLPKIISSVYYFFLQIAPKEFYVNIYSNSGLVIPFSVKKSLGNWHNIRGSLARLNLSKSRNLKNTVKAIPFDHLYSLKILFKSSNSNKTY